MPITKVERNGPPEAMTCPMVLCDTCQEPITRARPGNVTWQHGRDETGRPIINPLHFVHKGACDRAINDQSSGELSEFLEQLLHNYNVPLTAPTGVEFVAPAPSSWRLRGREWNPMKQAFE